MSNDLQPNKPEICNTKPDKESSGLMKYASELKIANNSSAKPPIPGWEQQTRCIYLSRPISRYHSVFKFRPLPNGLVARNHSLAGKCTRYTRPAYIICTRLRLKALSDEQSIFYIQPHVLTINKEPARAKIRGFMALMGIVNGVQIASRHVDFMDGTIL